jgi:hypothetical protein
VRQGDHFVYAATPRCALYVVRSIYKALTLTRLVVAERFEIA